MPEVEVRKTADAERGPARAGAAHRGVRVRKVAGQQHELKAQPVGAQPPGNGPAEARLRG